MTDRRYSIIPARAVTDDRIERGDLQVLAYLGTFTDKLGWCFLAQGTIAEALGCGRATVQRALARLVDAGWVQVKSSTVGGRPHACHAYRVLMDRDDPEIGPSEFEVEDQQQEQRCPPAGTSNEAEVPIQDGHGCPPTAGTGVPTHTRAQKDQDSELHGGDGCARAKPLISAEAHEVATELARIAGHDPEFLPPTWMSYGPAMQVQRMLDEGWQRQMMIETARSVMGAKRDGPPATLRYFERPFATAHARQSSPDRLPTVTPILPKPEFTDAKASADNRPTDWKSSRDSFRRAHAKLRAHNEQQSETPDRRAPGGEVVQLPPAPRRA